jgi:hypothetical protein
MNHARRLTAPAYREGFYRDGFAARCESKLTATAFTATAFTATALPLDVRQGFALPST